MKGDNKIILNAKYPYPELLRALNIELDIDTYKNLNFKKLPFLAEHVSLLPLYTYAKCPICNFVVRSKADTYSLSLGWQASYGSPILQTSLYVTQYNQKLHETVIFKTIQQPDFPHCNHFVATQTFVQLHGMKPDFYTWHSCEFVYLINSFLPEDIPSYAILHGLPICEIVNNQFQPTYTAFSVTYFSGNRQELFSRWWKKQLASDIEYPSFVWESDIKNTDLDFWASKGKLGWLDIDDDSQPLQIRHGLSLPKYYQRINRLAEQYWWSKGIRK